MTQNHIISAVIILLIICTVAIPLIVDSTYDYDQYDEDGWQYDDYKQLSNVSEVSGSLEIVTLNGVTYVHANDLGEGTITYANGSSETVTVEKANLDVIVALGQSNNAYIAYDAATATCPDIGTAYYYGTDDAPLVGSQYATTGAMYPMVTAPGTSVIGDKAPAFCKEYYAHSSHKVYYVIGAWVGTSITTWQPEGTSYTAAATTVEKAMSAIDETKYNVETKGYTWIQGEKDYSMQTATYYDYFVTMNDSILSGGLGIELDHCFISKVKNTYAGPANAQMLLAKNLDTVTMSSVAADTFTVDNGLMGSDDLHYSQAGDNVLGAALGKSATFYYYPWTTEDTPLNNLILVIPVIMIISAICYIAAGIVVNRND